MNITAFGLAKARARALALAGSAQIEFTCADTLTPILRHRYAGYQFVGSPSSLHLCGLSEASERVSEQFFGKSKLKSSCALDVAPGPYGRTRHKLSRVRAPVRVVEAQVGER